MATTIPTLKNTTIAAMIDDLSDIIDNLQLGAHDCIGLRGLYATETDTTLAPSYIWEDGESTGEQLDGTSALLVAGTWEYVTWDEIESNLEYALATIPRYGDGRYAVIAGRHMVDAITEDSHEVVITDARVIAYLGQKAHQGNETKEEKKMKKIINGKVYNTQTAKCVGEMSWGSTRDFAYCNEKLYRKRTGEYFLFGEGGGMSKYAKSVGQNSWGWGEAIIPMSENEARKWAEKHLDGDEYEKIFGAVEEPDITTRINWTLDTDIVEDLRQRTVETGVPVSRMVSDVLRVAGYGKK